MTCHSGPALFTQKVTLNGNTAGLSKELRKRKGILRLNSLTTLLSGQVPHLWIIAVCNCYHPSGWCLFCNPPATNKWRQQGCCFAWGKPLFGETETSRVGIYWGGTAGTFNQEAGLLSPWWRICQLSLNRATASAWIKGFLLAVVISGTYDMLSSGWLTLRSSSQSSHSSGWCISKETTLDFKYDGSKPQAKSAFHSYTQQQAQLPLTFLIVGSIMVKQLQVV